MKISTKFLLTSAMFAAVLPLTAADCLDPGTNQIPCESDDDCVDATDLTNPVCDLDGAGSDGEGFCVNGEDGGEGEGEGEGESACADQDTELGAGTGLEMTDASLEIDAAGEESADCSGIANTDSYTLAFIITESADFNGAFQNANAMDFATTSTVDTAVYALTFCNGGVLTGVNLNDPNFGDCDGTDDCLIICPLCLSATPPDLAAQFTATSGDSTDGTCVEIL